MMSRRPLPLCFRFVFYFSYPTSFAYHECMCVKCGEREEGGARPGALACVCGGAHPKYHVAKKTVPRDELCLP